MTVCCVRTSCLEKYKNPLESKHNPCAGGDPSRSIEPISITLLSAGIDTSILYKLFTPVTYKTPSLLKAKSNSSSGNVSFTSSLKVVFSVTIST